jgi:hypothetical protein
VKLAVAVMVHKPQIHEVFFTPAFLGNRMMNVQFLAIFQVLVADWANALLPLDELSATVSRHLRFGSSLLPVIL